MHLKTPFTHSMLKWIDVFMRRSMHNFIHFAKENSISMSQMNSLMHMHRKGTVSVSDISKHLGITKAASSQLLDRLFQNGIILRKEDPEDRRNKLIQLSETGEHLITEAMHARQQWIEDLEDLLNDDEKEKVIQALNILSEKANQLPDPHKDDCH